MLYFLDCEFNSFGGELISLALAAENGKELYLARPREELDSLVLHHWVAANVIPVLDLPEASPEVLARARFAARLRQFLSGDPAPVILADWPEDISHLMQCLIVSPGQMVLLPTLTLRLIHAPPRPDGFEGAVPHNALWDARALRRGLMGTRSPQ